MSAQASVSQTVRKVAELVQQLKATYDAKRDEACVQQLAAIKRHLITLPTYLAPLTPSATRSEELMLTRETLEIGVLVNARRKDLDSVELFMNQLQVYYTDVGVTDLPESPRYMMILGLNLVRLLVQSRIAQFHSELEKIPYDMHANDSYIRFAVLLERYLMEGSYHKLLHSRKRAPSNEYLPVVEMLESTVRDEVAQCIPHSSTVLALSAAQKILMVKSREEVMQIGRDYNWTLSPDGTSFVFSREEDVIKKEIPYLEVVRNNMDFAMDMQNIV